jgi:hypothetical protein|tara:strand:- start:7398 stop:7625 length:228 start_codon:yes stop_codon:yes gene_type:complete
MLHPDYGKKTMIDKLITFSWAKDYRTYVLGIAIFAAALFNFLSGDISIGQFLDQFVGLAAGPTVIAMRAGIAGLK